MLDRGRRLDPVAGPAGRPRGGPRPRLRPPAGLRPPRHQAGQPALRRRRPPAHRRLRPGPRARRGGVDRARTAPCSAPPATPRPSRPGAAPLDGRSDVYSLALTLDRVGHRPGALRRRHHRRHAHGPGRQADARRRPSSVRWRRCSSGPGAPSRPSATTPASWPGALVQAAERLPRPAPLPLVPTLAAAAGVRRRHDARRRARRGRPDAGRRLRSPARHSALAAPPRVSGVRRSAGSAGPAATAEIAAPGGARGGRRRGGRRAPLGPVIRRCRRPPPTIYDEERDRPGARSAGSWSPSACSCVAALVAGGILIFQRTRTESHDVTSLVGLPRAEALNRIAEFDWKTDVQHQRSDAQPFDVRVRPEPQGRQAEGGRHPHPAGVRRAHAARPARHQPAAPGGGAGHADGRGPHPERGRPAVRRDPAGRRHPRLVGRRHAQPGGPAGADGHRHRRHRCPRARRPASSPTSSTTPSTRPTPP